MYRAIPVGNKILARKWQKENDARLQGNIMNIKASIDHKQPSKVDHLKKKSKKTQMAEGKYLTEGPIRRYSFAHSLTLI